MQMASLWWTPLLRRRLRREFSRVGIQGALGSSASLFLAGSLDVWVERSSVVSGRVVVSRHGALELEWNGNSKELLRLLKGLDDDAGPLAFWQAARPGAAEVEILTELSRIDVAPRDARPISGERMGCPPADICFRASEATEPKKILGEFRVRSGLQVGGITAYESEGPPHWWAGPCQEALRRLRELPDDAGAAAFWAALPAESTRVSYDEAERLLEAKLVAQFPPK
jgi:hypothetical protein